MDYIIDLETLGTMANSPVLSIGIVAVDREKIKIVDELDIRVEVEAMRGNAAFRCCPDTLAWWEDQTPFARSEAFSGWVAPDAALDSISDFFFDLDRATDTGPKGVWGYGSIMDVAVMEYMHNVYGFDCPWTYKEVRCLRTALSEAGISLKDHRTEGETHHVAIDDARTEARAFMEYLRRK